MGYEPEAAAPFLYSLAAEVLGALVFSFTRTRHHDSPVLQEAIIGFTYVTASATAILVDFPSRRAIGTR